MTDKASHRGESISERQSRPAAIEFEGLVRRMTSLFTEGPVGDIDRNIDTILPLLIECLGVDRGYVCEFAQKDSQKHVVHAWPVTACDTDAGPATLALDDLFPWSIRRVLKGEETVISCLGDLPAEANQEKVAHERDGVGAYLTLPIAVAGLNLGYLVAGITATEHCWSENHLQRFRVTTSLLANALERKRTSLALRTSGRWFRLLVENAPDAVLLVRRDGTVALINDEAERLFGHTPFELIGQPVETLLPEAARQGHTAHRAGYVAAPHPRRMGAPGLEFSARTKDGRELPVEVSLTPVGDEEGLVLCVVRDVSHRRRIEQELRAAVTEKLKVTRARLDDREARLEDDHRHVTDSFRLVGDLIRLQQQRRTGDPGVAAELSEIQNRIDAVASVHDALYRSGSLATVELGHYLAELTTHLVSRYDADRRGVTVVLGIDPLTASFDVGLRCGLIVGELVTNALKHAFPAGRPGTISVTLRQSGADGWDLTVRDDGAGAPQGLDLDGLGFRLVESFATQLGGSAAFSDAGGVEARVRLCPDQSGGAPARTDSDDRPSSTASSAQ
jgi:PAS domain S-box-containing protein